MKEKEKCYALNFMILKSTFENPKKKLHIEI